MPWPKEHGGSDYERVEGSGDKGPRTGRWITTKSGHRVYLTGEGKAGKPPTSAVVVKSKRPKYRYRATDAAVVDRRGNKVHQANSRTDAEEWIRRTHA